MTDKLWRNAIVGPDDSVLSAVRHIDASGLQIALVVDADGKLLGTVTDGDVRRAILRGVELQHSVREVMNAHPTVARADSTREELVAQMKAQVIRHMPLVDEAGRLIGLQQLEELLAPAKRENRVVLMAGGLGTRLSPLTDDCPKPMLRVGDRPILETILLNFIAYGFHRFTFAVNHRAEVIEEYFGDGAKWHVSIEYLHEEQRLGTAGALGLLPERPAEPVVVMNGDVLTKINLASLLDFHHEHKAVGTMCVREFEYRVPYGVIELEGHQILKIEEKPRQKFFVNAGVYVLSPQALDLVTPGDFLDMTDLFQAAVERKQHTAVFPVREYWIDIGQHDEFARAGEEFDREFASRVKARGTAT